jgi:hypothetical protein
MGPYTVDGRLPADLVNLRRFATLMDDAFTFPGTTKRFGIDAVVGLIPGIGDVLGAAMSMWIVAGAFRHRVPFFVMARILWNVLLDLLVGMIPVVGDLFDVAFKENVKNVDLIVSTRDTSQPPRSWGWFVVPLALVGVGMFLIAAAVFAFLYAAFMDMHRSLHL